jgi:hypothetical protein
VTHTTPVQVLATCKNALITFARPTPSQKCPLRISWAPMVKMRLKSLQSSSIILETLVYPQIDLLLAPIQKLLNTPCVHMLITQSSLLRMHLGQIIKHSSALGNIWNKLSMLRQKLLAQGSTLTSYCQFHCGIVNIYEPSVEG